MPYSTNAFDHYVSTVIGLLQPQTVCDIGPGAGKYAGIVRKAGELHGFATRITAVEIDETYVENSICDLSTTRSFWAMPPI